MNTGPQASVVVSVEITAEDIAQGIEGDCEACPVARALGRATGDGVSVDSDVIVFHGRHARQHFSMNTPKEFAIFITRFDGFGAEHVEPFSYDLTLPAWIVAGEEAA